MIGIESVNDLDRMTIMTDTSVFQGVEDRIDGDKDGEREIEYM
jgi:hypothetical protein